MKVLDALYWVPKRDVDLIRVRDTLTLYKKAARGFDPDDTPTPVPLYDEDGDMIGVPRAWGLGEFGPPDEDNRSCGSLNGATWEFTGTLGGKGREKQEAA